MEGTNSISETRIDKIEETLLYMAHFKDWINNLFDLIGFQDCDSKLWTKVHNDLVQMDVIDPEDKSLTKKGLFCLHMKELNLRSAIFQYQSIVYGIKPYGFVISTFMSMGMYFLKSQDSINTFWTKYKSHSSSNSSDNDMEMNLGDLSPILLFVNMYQQNKDKLEILEDKIKEFGMDKEFLDVFMENLRSNSKKVMKYLEEGDESEIQEEAESFIRK